MDKQTVLATVWVTIWNSYRKKLLIETLSNFTGDKHLFDSLVYIRTKAEKLGYNVKYGRKYVSLEKKV